MSSPNAIGYVAIYFATRHYCALNRRLLRHYIALARQQRGEAARCPLCS